MSALHDFLSHRQQRVEQALAGVLNALWVLCFQYELFVATVPIVLRTNSVRS